MLTWQEFGGPEVIAPTRRGFGSAMIERSLRATLRGEAEIVYDPAGLVFSVNAPLAAVMDEGE